MAFERLYGAFCFVGPFIERCAHLPFDLEGIEVVLEGTGVFVVQYLYFYVVAMVTEPTVSSGVGLLQGRCGAGRHGFNVNVLLVD